MFHRVRLTNVFGGAISERRTMANDIVERLKEAEGQADGEIRKTIHDAWNNILWMREAVALSKRAVEIAETKVTPNALANAPARAGD